MRRRKGNAKITEKTIETRRWSEYKGNNNHKDDTLWPKTGSSGKRVGVSRDTRAVKRLESEA